ncbi:hypothetical protein COV42_02740 [Candidatus Campbellbacteria bacterium CG11_big_fil_rev_8_21_14_0_20_44_21]|uniref:NlpC/P60 domain-containing protein n=1 Tax=Candidatus Campbellbacteria bacterium CG22_combo_CG10-13_8_21_14_all_43_18 TaxID=1974530 RepID=A0A2H0DWY2_9BACT|nr:MAG: hypothetical protein COW82_00725 [Candidatus Campbellbacteria bacterium CG22_combo_CG10-13_8_21_14_all_43_18]PIR24072.1 MAG: hypothetical protein COV42_02740 [Candidatus Campbellbacteria bacterium CG11_big_fil_rev_8_21_14_0_20_44_21]
MPEIRPLIKESLLCLIRNSVGTKMFQNFFCLINGKKKDIIENGRYACAFFVSSALNIFGLISEGHTTVDGTLKDMKKNGFEEIKKPKEGSVILWEERDGNRHLGFYIGKEKAISARPEKKTPMVHDFKYRSDARGERKIEKIFWHKKLDE